MYATFGLSSRIRTVSVTLRHEAIKHASSANLLKLQEPGRGGEIRGEGGQEGKEIVTGEGS